jgi:hypothetical protein
VNNDGPADNAARVGRVKADDLVENDYVGFAAKKGAGKCYKMAPKIQKLTGKFLFIWREIFLLNWREIFY